MTNEQRAYYSNELSRSYAELGKAQADLAEAYKEQVRALEARRDFYRAREAHGARMLRISKVQLLALAALAAVTAWNMLRP